MNFVGPKSVIVNGDMSSDVVSDVITMEQLVMLSYAITWVGAGLEGVITVEVSNDFSTNAAGQIKNPGTWTTLPLSGTGAVDSDDDSGFIDIDANAGYAMRLRYTAEDGTGSLNVIAMGK